MSATDELLPCPICGGQPDFQHFNITPNVQGRIICACGIELRQGKNDTEDDMRIIWNTRTDYAVQAENERKVEQAIAATLGGGTLTADQVRDAIERHSAWVIGNNRCFHNGAYEAIADELNATLGCGECELEETESYECRRFDTADPKLYATRLTVHVLECSNCGKECEHVNGDYEYCPHCLAKNKLF